MSAFRRILRVTRQVVAIGTITLVLAEATIRAGRYFVPSAFPANVFYDQSYNRYRGKPGAPDYDFRLNSAGFKDVEFKPTKEPGTYRILGVGDSFTFGVVPYQHNYLTLVEQNLNEAGRHTEIINMGIPGAGPQDYLSLVANEGLQLQPDMVLVSFFVGNDFEETMRWRTKLYEFSDLLALAKYVVDTRTKFSGQIFHRQAAYDDNASFFRDTTFVQVEQDRSWVYVQPTPHSEAFADAVRYLLRIKELCASKGIAFMVLVIPDEVQMNKALQGKVLAGLQLRAEQVDFTYPNRFLDRELGSHEVDRLDVLDSFLARSVQVSLYKPNDTHWNIAGNRLAADLLTAHLAKRLAVGASTPAKRP